MRRLNQRPNLLDGRQIGLLALSIAILAMSATTVQAFGNDSSSRKSQARKSRLGLSIVDVDLPFEFKARLDGLYARTRHAIDALAYNRWLSPGPAVQPDSLLQSRVSVGREIWDGVELEVAWSTQTSLSLQSFAIPDRQTVGAFIRLTR